MALGADAASMVRRLVGSGLFVALPGLVIGAGLSVVVGHALRALLLELSPFDPTALGSVALLLVAVVSFAAWLPARRAARVDPAASLRQE
jgi:ABC-type antimicrobial peptide transport system permease subunit